MSMAELLDGRQRLDGMNEVLQNRQSRLDPNRMKIVTEGKPARLAEELFRRSFLRGRNTEQ